MEMQSRYSAHIPDKNGHIHYTEAENKVWQTLYARQMSLVADLACKEYLDGIHKLLLVKDRIPQAREVSTRLQQLTGWSVENVPALISSAKFFRLLSEKKFPAASFIRRVEDLDYLPEPDIFHEIFGHCPALTDPNFAAFTQEVGKFGLSLAAGERILLERLYWFTVEFGLINTGEGLRIYGAGIVSSKTESIYALKSEIPVRNSFDLVEAMRTPYRYDHLQKIYFIINSFEDLYNTIKGNRLQAAFTQARQLGDVNNNLYTTTSQGIN